MILVAQHIRFVKEKVLLPQFQNFFPLEVCFFFSIFFSRLIFQHTVACGSQDQLNVQSSPRFYLKNQVNLIKDVSKFINVNFISFF